MDLKDLQSFVVVAEAHGFRAAAQRMDVEQSALSRRVSKLEDELGVSLFERHRGGVRLTRAGECLREDVRQVLASLDAALSRARAAGVGKNGRLRLGVGATLFGGQLQKLIHHWREQHPGVELSIFEASPQDHAAAIIGRELDVAIVAGSDWAVGCELEELWHDPVTVVAPLGLASAFGASVKLGEIGSQNFIVSRYGFGPQVADWITRRLSTLSHSPRIEFVDASRSVLFSMVGLGFGLTFGTSAEAEVPYPNIAFLPVESESIPYCALWSADNDNPALRRFLSLARLQARGGSGVPSRTPDRSP
jgi:DNA-binding transcriptional LysR family regulator